jgi:hypothetical protein
MGMKKRSLKKLKRTKKVVINFIYDLLLGGKEYDTEIEKTAPLPLKAILGTVISTVLVLALVFSFIQISALSSDIGDLKKEAVSLTTREGKLRDDLNHKYPHAELMDAIEALGFSANGGEIIILPEEAEE